MSLIRLIYASTIVRPYESSDIESILVSARKNNAKAQVTGLLCFNRKYFIQCLEGSREAVNETFNKILNDPRHEKVAILSCHDIHQRDFSEWEMGYISENKITKEIALEHSESTDFEPYQMADKSAYLLMLTLRDKIPII